MDAPIRCVCPKVDGQTRHPDGDTVTLPDILDFRKTLTVRQYVSHTRTGDESLPEFLVVLIEAYLLHCITAWSVEDEAGKPLPVTKAAIAAVLMTDANMDVAEQIGDHADRLYSDKVFLPLLNGASSSSPGTSTGGSTSRTSGRGSTPRKLSRRSSTSTTPMGVTGPMAASPAGVSN
jgi:hypothetical protein